MSNYELLTKYDNNSLIHNWIYITDKNENKSGIAILIPNNKVKIFIGENNRVVDIDEFNNEFIIDKVTDHYGEIIKLF